MLDAISCHSHDPRIDRAVLQRCRPGARTAASHWPIAAALWTCWTAWCESLAAHRQYERLRSRGIGHHAALREVVPLSPAQTMHASGKPLLFAGRA